MRERRTVNYLLPFVITWIAFYLSCKDSGNPVDDAGEVTGKLTFVMTDSTEGPGGVYTMNLDGTSLKPVAIAGDSVRFPGSWGDYYVINRNYPLSNPRWSPNGEKIACTLMWAFEGYVLMVMNADGSDKHVLWKVRSAAQQPRWSQQGDRILFMRSGYLGTVIGTGIVDSTGENDHNFTIVGNTDPYVFQGDSLWFLGNYQWGSDGILIYGLASVNKKPKTNPDGSNNSKELNVEIFSFDSEAGVVLNRITRNEYQEWLFHVSPDGKYVIFPGEFLDQPFNFLSLADNKLRQILTGGQIDFFFSWSSDSRMIVYAMDQNSDPFRTDYYVYAIDLQRPNEIRKLTTFSALQAHLFIQTN